MNEFMKIAKVLEDFKRGNRTMMRDVSERKKEILNATLKITRALGKSRIPTQDYITSLPLLLHWMTYSMPDETIRIALVDLSNALFELRHSRSNDLINSGQVT